MVHRATSRPAASTSSAARATVAARLVLARGVALQPGRRCSTGSATAGSRSRTSDRSAHRRARAAGRCASKYRYFLDSVFSFIRPPDPRCWSSSEPSAAWSRVVGLRRYWCSPGWPGSSTSPGYTALMLVMLIVGDQRAARRLGVVGSYVWRTYENTKGRPTAPSVHDARDLPHRRRSVSAFVHPQALCESEQRRRRHPRLGLRPRAARRRHRRRLQHLRRRLRRERRRRRRSGHREVRRPALGRRTARATTSSSGPTRPSPTTCSRAVDEYPDSFATTVVGTGASIGANATILPGVRIGRRAMVGAGAVVTKDVPPNAVVVGNPARIVGLRRRRPSRRPAQRRAARGRPDRDHGSRDPSRRSPDRPADPGDRPARQRSSPSSHDGDLPFVPAAVLRRSSTCRSRDVRGEHAHRGCEQVLVCLRGSVHGARRRRP